VSARVAELDRVRLDGPPPGYEHISVAGVRAVAAREAAAAVREALARGTLYDYAAGQYAARESGARLLMGRAPAFAVALPPAGGQRLRVVVRRSHHGGLLAPLTGDRFLTPTRAPRELRASLRLRELGVRTPDVVAYALYGAGPLLRRADVATREIAEGRDLAAVLTDNADVAVDSIGRAARGAVIGAVAELLRSLTTAGARHPDLNAKNVLLAPSGGASPIAYVLDVDRVVFAAAGSRGVTEANLRRLGRSLRKLRARSGLPITDDDLALLASEVDVNPLVALQP
jgi:hypothetical protein